METQSPPMVIPMWLSGFDQLMPEGRAFPWKYLPRIGARLNIAIGQPISATRIREALDVQSIIESDDVSPHTDHQERLTGWLGSEAAERLEAVKGVHIRNPRYSRIIRERVTTLIHREVEALGRSVCGPLLAMPVDRSRT